MYWGGQRLSCRDALYHSTRGLQDRITRLRRLLVIPETLKTAKNQGGFSHNSTKKEAQNSHTKSRSNGIPRSHVSTCLEYVSPRNASFVDRVPVSTIGNLNSGYYIRWIGRAII